MSDAELADFQDAKKDLENYEKIYEIVEYVSELNENITLLQRRMMTNNPTIPQNMYRQCPGNSFEKLFPEIETYLKAYYDLMDDCKEFPHWERKLQEDLGGVVSFLAVQLEEKGHDDLVGSSDIYARFDDDKQVYFK